jgi:hypothetical protein
MVIFCTPIFQTQMIPVIIRSKIEKFFSKEPLGLCTKVDRLYLRRNHLPIIPMYVFGVFILKIGILSDRVIDLLLNFINSKYLGRARFQILQHSETILINSQSD